ncbi:hypothetical protein Taro_030010 [Colocasia esculenta]|uniref:4-hydroxyphenylpyruvate dioxygenase n=1 Tax=Colocasia esculenta TaxID=4460 RepID=A0A843VKD3_COLES|nr:hypothetical protein [Colocasia esculenta]
MLLHPLPAPHLAPFHPPPRRPAFPLARLRLRLRLARPLQPSVSMAVAEEAEPHQAKPHPQPRSRSTNGDTGKESEFRLVGYSKFVRTNPRGDRFPVKGFHHVEFWCADATNTSRRFSFGLGMPLASRSDLSTGNPVHASYLLQSGDLRFLFTAPYSSSPAALATVLPDPEGLVATPAIPSFDAAVCRRFSNVHGLGVRAVALLVEDAASAFHISVANGARPAFPPAVLSGGAILSEVELYGDVVLRYVSVVGGEGAPRPWSFLPGFEDAESPSPPLDYGIRRLDHAVGNVPELAPVLEYIRRFTGFHEFAEFTAEDVGTAESGLNSVVLANNDERVLIPLNEPVHGTKRRSQIQTYLDHNEGPGLQHLALASGDVLATLRRMRAVGPWGGFEFMPPPPPTYYRNLRRRAADVLTEAQMEECEKLGVLVDRDDQGVLLQIFTKPVGDRPTIFLEIIQRIGCMVKEEGGREYQKGGCGGFGKGNFSELFKSIEEYEKSLEAKQILTPSTA